MGHQTSLRALRSLSSCLTAHRIQPQTLFRPFSSSTHDFAKAPFTPQNQPVDSVDNLLTNVGGSVSSNAATYSGLIPRSGTLPFQNKLAAQEWAEDDRHHMHIYAHKHNTHITLTKPNRDPLISVSCGNIGFRKAGRGTYDAAYQLTAFVMNRIQDKGLLPQIRKIELVYRGFGAGREGVTKAILGSEGKHIRPKVTRLSDSTRLKFGGVRSKKPRRLG